MVVLKLLSSSYACLLKLLRETEREGEKIKNRGKTGENTLKTKKELQRRFSSSRERKSMTEELLNELANRSRS